MCGAIAGLILVVGYLAYSGQRGAAIASAASPVMMEPAQVAVMPQAEPEADVQLAPEPVAEPGDALAIDQVSETDAETDADADATPEPAPRAHRAHAVARPLAKRHAASAHHRRPLRLNDATPLGDLRPSRSRRSGVVPDWARWLREAASYRGSPRRWRPAPDPIPLPIRAPKTRTAARSP